MTALPNLRIVIDPYEGLVNNWKWKVERWKEDPKRPADLPEEESWGYWLYCTDSGWSVVEGYTRTEEKARIKARRAAARICEDALTLRERQSRQERERIIENVTCGGA